MFIIVKKNAVFDIYQDVQNDYANGFTKKELQRKYQKSKATINKCLVCNTNHDYKVGDFSKTVFEFEYWKNGLKCSDIADKYCVGEHRLDYARIIWGIRLTQYDRHNRVRSKMTEDEWIHHIRDHLEGVHKDRWKKTEVTKEFIYQKYIVEGMSKVDIASFLGCSHSTIDKWFNYYNIFPLSQEDLNTRIQATSISYKNKIFGDAKEVINSKVVLKNVSSVISDKDIHFKYQINDCVRSFIVLRDFELLNKYIKRMYGYKPSIVEFHSCSIIPKENNCNIFYMISYQTLFNYVKKFGQSDNFKDIISGYGSKYEGMIAEYLDKKHILFEMHNRRLLNGLELDFYFNHLNKALEVNGLTYHFSNNPNFNLQNKKKSRKSKYFHQNKLLYSYLLHDMKLTHIYEFEMRTKNRRALMKKRVLNFLQPKVLNQTLTKGLIDKRRCLEFLNNYNIWEYYLYQDRKHVQYFGLFDKHHVLQLVYVKYKNGIIKHVTSSYNYDYESLIEQLIKHEPNSIIYSNLENGFYGQLDFTKITEPKYINTTSKGLMIGNDDYRYLSNKYYQTYNSGYQIINT